MISGKVAKDVSRQHALTVQKNSMNCVMAHQKTAKIVVKTELESPHQKIQKAEWTAKIAVTVIETASPDQKTEKTVREISYHDQKAQLIVEKLEQNSNLHSTAKVVAEAYQRLQVVKLKSGDPMSTDNQLPCGQ